MGVIERTTGRIREILAQQSWLEAWRPTIEATPDWALLAAAPGAVLVVWLVLRLGSQRRARPRHQHDRPDDRRAPVSASTTRQPHEAGRPTPTRPAAPAALREAIPDEHGSASHFERGGAHPDAILRCTIQLGDNDSTDFLDGLVGAYREGRFLRILMQNDECDDESDYWHSWDVRWSEIVQIILRKRTTPTVHTNTRQPDGAYARKGPYLQTRVYKVGRGMDCRLLDRDDPGSAAPYQWLRANLHDPDIRFAEDTQENALYGDTTYRVIGDSLDAYALDLKQRSQRADDEEFSKRALSTSELTGLRQAALNKTFQCKAPGEARWEMKDISAILASFEPWYAQLVEEDAQGAPPALKDYAKSVIERLLLGAVRPAHYALFYYDHFPSTVDADGAARARALRVVRWLRPDGGGGVASVNED